MSDGCMKKGMKDSMSKGPAEVNKAIKKQRKGATFNRETTGEKERGASCAPFSYLFPIGFLPVRPTA